jgi:hypothetical protein
VASNVIDMSVLRQQRAALELCDRLLHSIGECRMGECVASYGRLAQASIANSKRGPHTPKKTVSHVMVM